MRHEARAILFDLDDTLFPHRRFRLSGFAAAARAIESQSGLSAPALFARLVAASRDPRTYGREVDAVLAEFSLGMTKAQLIEGMRAHRPNLRLQPDVRRTLERLRAQWRLAIVTNGLPGVQRRKLQALGLVDAVDVVIYATEYGSGEGKPDRAPFVAALTRLGIEAERAVFVGDDVRADIHGAACCGLRTIQTTQWRRVPQQALPAVPDAVVSRITDVPQAAEALVTGRLRHHAA